MYYSEFVIYGHFFIIEVTQPYFSSFQRRNQTQLTLSLAGRREMTVGKFRSSTCPVGIRHSDGAAVEGRELLCVPSSLEKERSREYTLEETKI